MTEKIGPLVLAGILFSIGAALAFDHYTRVRRGLASEEWPTVDGVVTARTGRQRVSRFWFDYEVDGAEYRAHEAGFMMRPMYRPQLAYSSGDTVLVYYNPQEPSIATLNPGVSWWGLAWSLLAPLALFGAGVWLIVVSRRE